MTGISESMSTINSLEELADKKTIIHQIHPRVKLILTLLYIVLVISYKPYDITGLTFYAFYPIILMVLGEIPFMPLFKRLLIALPFSFFAGLSNIFFDRQAAFFIGSLPITFGLISFFSIMLKTIFTVMAVLILIATTSMPKIAYQLLSFKLPQMIVEQIMLTYRYISVLLQEVSSMYTAYILRSPGAKGIKMQDMGVFVGQLLLRSFDRAENIYMAMKCRGYDGKFLYAKPQPMIKSDWMILLMTAGLLFLMRFFDLGLFIGNFVR
ncbi:MAG: cobalt/nickel transport system permease protein [Eubacteriaceae bacterium]|jgi:cobalt/nickel transport system permease protein|nr:cobalt/nickel transport system permease protein [Eubacteriaceae bacterium]MDK2904187.1 cobalt/nickel transport system permease protein [Eubacteriaceae bacterium]MDK2937741.1 cobalt/nickel transport system permease protein [Eubacteriaceae bacterium]MDN5308042.1 cobalt/nickel transport system permease protein [Eubacteriaceae bacterium]